jgi:hypothetical protein
LWRRLELWREFGDDGLGRPAYLRLVSNGQNLQRSSNTPSMRIPLSIFAVAAAKT